MTVIDLGRTIEAGMPVYPGTEGPSISDATTIAKDGFAEKLLAFYSHTGTHIDAPAHMIEGGSTLDSMPVSSFVGQARVIDIAAFAGREVGLDDVAGELPHRGELDFLLWRTGWSSRWGSPGYYEGFPILSLGLVNVLAELGLKGLGFDAISIDPVGSVGFERHLVVLGHGMIVIENLGDLESLGSGAFLFSCLPLKMRDADGSPVRAVAIRP